MGRAKLAYIEFVDEAGMKAGLEKHAEVRFFDSTLLPVNYDLIKLSTENQRHDTRG
jgi:hypothetical protein